MCKNNLDIKLSQVKEQLENGDLLLAKSDLTELALEYGDIWKIWIFFAGIATRERDIDASLTAFRKLVKISPSSAFASSGLTRVLYQLRRYEETKLEITRFSKCVDHTDPDVEQVLAEHSNILSLLNDQAIE